MDLLIAILMCLRLTATPERLNDADFIRQNQEKIDLATLIIDNNYYREVDGGVVIDDGIGQ